jgi:hypothetical protein
MGTSVDRQTVAPVVRQAMISSHDSFRRAYRAGAADDQARNLLDAADGIAARSDRLGDKVTPLLESVRAA